MMQLFLHCFPVYQRSILSSLYLCWCPLREVHTQPWATGSLNRKHWLQAQQEHRTPWWLSPSWATEWWQTHKESRCSRWRWFNRDSAFYLHVQCMMAAPKAMLVILLCWTTMSEADVGGMAVEVEPSHHYFTTFCQHVIDGRRGAV